jgi:hypothetical protein
MDVVRPRGGSAKLRRSLGRFRLASAFDRPFFFCEGVHFVKGAVAGAIYDLNSGRVYALDPLAAGVVRKLQGGATPREVALQDCTADLFTVLEVQRQLAHFRLGRWGKPPQQQGTDLRTTPRPQTRLRFAWLELTRSCNLDCIHCYAESVHGPRAAGEFSLGEAQTIVFDLAEAGCSAIQFTGGEPLLVPSLVPLIGFARGAGFRWRAP